MNTWNIVAKAIKLEIDHAREQTFEYHNSGSNLEMWENMLRERVLFVQELIEGFSSLNPRFNSERFGKACGLQEDEIFVADRDYYDRIRAELVDLQTRRKISEL